MNKEILKNISILYVEDEDNVRKFTYDILITLLKNVYVASNGEDGLKIFEKNKKEIDLIITDINMPKMDGLAMCYSIKKINNHIPIIVTSAYNDTDFLKKSTEIGINTYAIKPIDLFQLIDSIIRAIEPIILKKKLIELNLSLKTKIEKEVNKIKSILDAQDNIIIVTNKKEITNVNKKFLDFFGINDFNGFINSKKNIFDFFIDESGFISKRQLTNQKSWFDYIQSLQEIDRIVKIRNLDNKEKIFAIHVDYCEHKDDDYVFSLTDITKFKEKSNILEYQASHDKLTGLYNRNKFDDIYSKEIKRAKRYNNDLSMIIFDVDNFKIINDTFGHQAGDEVLKDIARISLENIREQDIISRWGGEEFMILLPQTNKQGAVIVANKIRMSIESHSFTNNLLKITASFGVTQFCVKNDEEDSFMSKADKLLYNAKDMGKNIVMS